MTDSIRRVSKQAVHGQGIFRSWISMANPSLSFVNLSDKFEELEMGPLNSDRICQTQKTVFQCKWLGRCRYVRYLNEPARAIAGRLLGQPSFVQNPKDGSPKRWLTQKIVSYNLIYIADRLLGFGQKTVDPKDGQL